MPNADTLSLPRRYSTTPSFLPLHLASRINKHAPLLVVCGASFLYVQHSLLTTLASQLNCSACAGWPTFVLQHAPPTHCHCSQHVPNPPASTICPPTSFPPKTQMLVVGSCPPCRRSFCSDVHSPTATAHNKCPPAPVPLCPPPLTHSFQTHNQQTLVVGSCPPVRPPSRTSWRLCSAARRTSSGEGVCQL